MFDAEREADATSKRALQEARRKNGGCAAISMRMSGPGAMR